MTIDMTRLIEKLAPTQDGESPVTLRTGTVMAINSDGSLDVQVSGVTVSSVPRVTGASVSVGAIVQILSYRGGLLVLGSVSVSSASGAFGLWARKSEITDSAAIGTTLTTVLTTPTKTFLKNRVYDCRMVGGVQTAASGATYAIFSAYRTGPDTVIGSFFNIPIIGSNVTFRASGNGVLFTPGSSNVTGQVSLKMAHSAATVTHKVATGAPRYLEVWDVGDVSQFDNVTTW